MERIGLLEAIEALRSELLEATARAEGHDLHFPVGPVQLEFQVGVTREAQLDGKLKFWVLELGTGGRHEQQAVHKVTVNLEAPVDARGRPVKVTERSQVKP